MGAVVLAVLAGPLGHLILPTSTSAQCPITLPAWQVAYTVHSPPRRCKSIRIAPSILSHHVSKSHDFSSYLQFYYRQTACATRFTSSSTMSRFFPHSPYAEDQPLHHTVLMIHTIYRGFQTGAVAGAVSGTVRHFVRRTSPLLLSTTLLRSVGTGALIGAGFLAIATPARMWGKEEVEWQDRSWRLLENERQMEVDDFSLVGTILGTGALALAVRRGTLPRTGWRSQLGAAGGGSLAGTMVYMIYRYGYMGDKGD